MRSTCLPEGNGDGVGLVTRARGVTSTRGDDGIALQQGVRRRSGVLLRPMGRPGPPSTLRRNPVGSESLLVLAALASGAPYALAGREETTAKAHRRRRGAARRSPAAVICYCAASPRLR